ncbi:MAG: YafY family transcriptional regulator [Calditrichaeota bacterium]|nr:YafY family transcriptional regulator [Calditrichota bacterium]
MNRIDRLVAIVIFLQSKKIVRGKEIAGHFGISLRTVYRDINALCEAGIPIGAEAGEGYSIVEGYHLPPVMFTPDEAKALLTGAKLAEHMTDASIINHARSAMMKINSVLPAETKENLDRLKNSMALLNTPAIDKNFRDDVLLTIQDAIIAHHVLKMEYYVAGRDEWTKREVEPLGLIYYANHWHLYAWCRKRRDIRDFRTDRMRTIASTTEKFKQRPGVTLQEYLKEFAKIENPIEVQIRFNKRTAAFVRERFQFGIIEENHVGENIIITFITPDLDWIVPSLLAHSKIIEVIRPDILKEKVMQEARQIIDFYDKK